MNDTLIWVGIIFCISQSALFSGSNIAVFSLSRLRLEAAAAAGDKSAASALELRRDANFTLVTILMGNVAINVLLTMLADSVMVGVFAFLFSTVVITAIGEIVPQAYFSRNALQAVSIFAPVLKFYRILFWPIAKPTAHLLDLWVGAETIPWFRERELRSILRFHAENDASEVGPIEAIGAINFLALDDLVVSDQGSRIDPASIIKIEFDADQPVFPAQDGSMPDAFCDRLLASGQKWIVLTDLHDQPRLLLNTLNLLRARAGSETAVAAVDFCHAPVVLTDTGATLDFALQLLAKQRKDDPAHDETVLLVWTAEEKRVITGSDVLRCLLRGMDHPAKASGA
ncbi:MULTISPECIES: DUF21 domain-containing protein [unclassified Yoonia]|uniref:DUF21 domain-containing protein n=1 Tax=unclassified Yoonia TaxID=2629118 RepID=UPI002AFF8831|nr:MULTISPECIES: DUF21 domain-containing protein [unclassified Yoonia]